MFQFHNLRCQIKDHKQKDINEVCLEKNCSLPRAICHYCKKLHQNHQNKMIDIDDLEEFLKTFQPQGKTQQINNDVGNYFKEAKILLDTLQQDILKQFQQLQQFDNPINLINKNQGPINIGDLNKICTSIIPMVTVENQKIKFQSNDGRINQIREICIKDLNLLLHNIKQMKDILIRQIQITLNHPQAFEHIKLYQEEEEEEEEELDQVVLYKYFVNLYDSRILQQLYTLLQDKPLSQVKGLSIMTHQGGKLMSYLNKYEKLEVQLKGYEDQAKIIEFNELEFIEFNSSLKPIIKQGGDQIYIIEFKKEPFLNKIYFTKAERLRLSFRNVVKYIENHQIAKLLLKNFKEQQSIKPGHPLPDVQYTDPIVIKQNENEYMICEEYHPYPYTQFNRLIKEEIEIQNDKSDLNIYLQYFTFEGGIVLEDYNIQVINLVGFSDGKKTYLTDPHLNTDDQLIEKYVKKFVGLKLPMYYSVFQ